MKVAKGTKKVWSALALLLGMCVTSNSVLAGYGAIAYSASTGEVGYSDGYSCYDDAVNAAMSNCGYSDCVIENWEQNRCNAFATGNGLWGESYGYDDSGDAVNAALGACGSSCSWNIWICN